MRTNNTACKFYFVPFALFNYLLGFSTLPKIFVPLWVKIIYDLSGKKSPYVSKPCQVMIKPSQDKSTWKTANSQREEFAPTLCITIATFSVFFCIFLMSVSTLWIKTIVWYHPWVCYRAKWSKWRCKQKTWERDTRDWSSLTWILPR